MNEFNSIQEYEEWINSQDWYQKIELKNGLTTPGKFSTHKRLKYFDKIDFKGKTILDIGCNSGQYCLYAKEKGAARVVGVDTDKKRLAQAKTLALNEKVEIEYLNMNLFDLNNLGSFDIVLCVAVLTEIQDIFGAIEVLKETIGEYCFLELDLAKPLFYISSSKNWFKKRLGLPRNKAVLECRKSKYGMMLSPSMEVLAYVFGEEFNLGHRGKGIRYDIVDIEKAVT